MAEIALAGFVLSRINDALGLAKSVRARISKYSKGRDTFEDLSHNVEHLTHKIAVVKDIIMKAKKAPDNISENDSGPPDDISVPDSSAPEAGCVRRALHCCIVADSTAPEAVVADSSAPEDIVEIDTSAPLSDAFNTTFANVCATLKQVSSTMDKSFSTSFSARESGILSKIISCLCQFARAKELSDQMKELLSKIDRSSNELHHLIGKLNVDLNVDDLKDAVRQGVDGLATTVRQEVGDVKTAVLQGVDDLATTVRQEVGDVKTALQTMKDRAPVSQVSKIENRSGTSTPALDHTIALEFNTKDENGRPTTPEGTLKQSVLLSASSTTLTAAVGVMKPAISALGMAGVGKTVALQGLGHDEDIKNRFGGGVHYMTLGQGATLQVAFREISKILTNAGASVDVRTVENFASVKDAVDYAVSWFEGKICLFLVDDIWPTKTCKTGFLTELRQLVRGSPQSRMAISTRNVAIAQCAGSIVNFGARDPFGTVSENIFMAHATRGAKRESSANEERKLRNSVEKILSICSGLPIALAVTGSAVAFLESMQGNFENACDTYATQLEQKERTLGDEETMEGMSLNAGILLSLDFLEAEFLKWKAKSSPHVAHSVADFYTSLCVLDNQEWIPVSVLARLWQLDEHAARDIVNLFCGMSLCTLHLRRASSASSADTGIVLHDLQLDFCQRKAIAAKKLSFWHDQMLNGYLTTSHRPMSEAPSAQISQTFMSYEARLWWSEGVAEDGYIHANLSRHLSCAGRELELAALLLDARWTELRGRVGGILALKTDFELLQSFFRQSKSSRDHEATSDVGRSFEQIFKAVRVSWGRHASGWRPFQFQVCGRLLQLRQSNEVVETFLRSVETITIMPYLVPVSPLFPDIDGALILEIPVGGDCRCVACSPCGRYIAAGAGADIVVAESSTGNVLKRMHGHTSSVTCITFLAGSEKIACGSQDGKVMVRTWESSDTPTQVFQGHSSVVSRVAVSADGQRIISTGDRLVMTWDTTAGIRTWEQVEGSTVHCVAICAEDEKIAIGLGNGTLKVLDGITKETLFEDTKGHDGHVACVSFSPSGSYLATGSGDNTVRLWNTQTWTSKLFKGHDNWVTAVAFNRDGNRIASSSYDRTVRLWDVDSGKCVGVSSKTASRMKSVTFSADGERFVSGSADGVVRIWDARFGTESKEQRDGHNDAVWGVAISADGLRVASASSDGTVRLWDAVTGDHVGVPLEGHGRHVRCVSFSPDGQQVVSVSVDKTLRLWDTETCTQIGNPFEGHRSAVLCVSFSSDGLRVISGYLDGSIRMWNAETHEQIGDALHGHIAPVGCASESADGCHVVSRDFVGETIIFNNDSRAMIWSSENVENEIIDTEAEKIIRSCDPKTPQLWPNRSRFPEYTAELFCEKDCVYSNLLGEKTLMGNITSVDCWVCHKDRLISGSVGICKLITE